jgi:LysM repeat protein
MFASTYVVSTFFGNKRARAALVGAVVVLMVVAGSMAYEVKRGDTLSAIAAHYGVSVAALLEANDIPNPDLIRIGQSIIIPGEGGQADRIHVVASGETLGAIAVEYKTRSSEIASLNDLANPDLIRVGQKLKIPGGGTGSGERVGGNGPAYHVVAGGETLSSIANLYGISIEQLAEANGITNTSILYIGTRLQLSGETFVVETGEGSATHTVATGDTLGSIAASYGVSVSDIAAANGIEDINRIRVGQTLKIPGAGSWICPVPGAKYVNDWGFPRSGGRFHSGTDLMAAKGTEILAPVGGRVEVLTGKVGGLQFRLYGEDDVTYIGSHLDAFGRSGAVAAGEVIGRVGDTGNARGGPTHLHFEIHPGDGDATNPFPTLQEAGC